MLEVCIDSYESAKNAVIGGAQRLEVCSALSEGGLTPSMGLVNIIRKFLNVTIYVMIRIRSGNYIYSREEMDAMLFDLKNFKEAKLADGFVFGALTNCREIDICYCKEIISAAFPLPVTFHRAFDEINNPLEGIEILQSIHFRRILSSGQKDTAEKGIELLEMMCSKVKEYMPSKMVIIPCCGITPENILFIKSKTKATEFHSSARKKRELGENERNRVRIGSAVTEENFVMVTDSETVRKMINIINVTDNA